jgi:glyoxylase-like metal-dependent hydrolase (beta-lactamase superfamily II)
MTTAPRTPDASGISHPWPEPPRMGGIITVAPGIKWLRMPLPFRLDHINLYLLEDDKGWTVVDAGIGLDRTRDLWQGVLDGQLGGKPVTRVIVTHFHPDHMGNAHWLTERCGVDLWCSQAEWLMAQLAWRAADQIEGRLAHYERNGVSGGQLDALRERARHYGRVVPSVTPSFYGVRDGDVLTIGERAWEALTVYGHSPEQVVLHSADAGILISGDQVLPKITTNVSVSSEQPLGNPLRWYLDSLGRFAGIPDGTLVLPSHGLPFEGLQTRLHRLRLHHDERLAHASDALGEPRTGAQVLPLLFSRDLDLHQFGFAFGETLAHLHYLEWQGRAVRIVGEDGRHRFVRC